MPDALRVVPHWDRRYSDVDGRRFTDVVLVGARREFIPSGGCLLLYRRDRLLFDRDLSVDPNVLE
jgi:hypothetical protein